MIEPLDDHPHPVAPEAFMTWKENWCFSGVDLDTQSAVVFHISLRPQHGEGIFTAKAQGEDLRIRHVSRSPIPTDLTALRPVADDRVSFEVLEEAERFRLVYDGEDESIDLTFTGRFAPFDFLDGPKAPGASTLGEIGRCVFPFRHYEQSLAFEGSLTTKGRRIEVAGWGNRDHSWGWRDDFGFRKHHWVCASFEDRYVQGSAMLETSYPDLKHGGFVSTADGNTAAVHVDTSDAYWEEPANEPLPPMDQPVRYRVTTEAGDEHVVVARLDQAVARLYLNARSDDRSQVYQDCQVFCPYTNETTGQDGAGLLEVGKYLQGRGIADRIRRS